MLAVKFRGNNKVDTVDVPVPEVRDGWVLVKTMASCICGSDLHAYHAGEGKSFTPGHEAAGEVVEIGKNVNRVKVGDRVSINNMHTCGYCQYCRSGDLIFCPDVKIVGAHLDGGDAEFSTVPERNCLLLPDDVTYEQGALIGDGIGTPHRAIKR